MENYNQLKVKLAMKQTYFLLALSISATQLFSQTIFTYGGTPVGKDEFLRAYYKNKTPVTDKEKALREYLSLYTRFKLKVQAAQALRLDTLQQLKYDMQNFSSQVEDSYMNDDKRMTALLDEAIARGQKDIHLIHFFAPLTSASTPQDSIKAVKAMDGLAEALHTGTAGYTSTVKKISDVYMPVTAKDIGFVTVLTMPYEMENAVYNLLPNGKTSIIKSKTGLHIFKEVEERKSAGKWKIAQILFAIPPGATADEIKAIQKRADSVYGLLKAGAEFFTLAKQYSEDRLTALNGGEMPEFGTGKFDIAFESKVFELQKDGAISTPIPTDYGYHIVKRLQQRPMPDKSDEAYATNLKQQIAKDSRINAAKESFLQEIMVKVGYKKNVAVKDEILFRYADSVVVNKVVGNYPINNKPIFSFAKATVKGADWLNFVKDYKLNTDVYKGENNKGLLNKFIATSTTDYYRKHLAEYNEDFKYQLQEFKEGNMLFEVMERNVWSKASSDSIGLKKYYDAHTAKYSWDSSAIVLLFNCSDIKTANETAEALKSGKDWKQITEESNGKVQADSGRYELSQLQLPAGLHIIKGIISSPSINSGDNTTTFVKVLQLFPAKQQRSFNEARGLVINDYQNYLEEKWMEVLSKKYPIKVNEPVFNALIK